MGTRYSFGSLAKRNIAVDQINSDETLIESGKLK